MAVLADMRREMRDLSAQVATLVAAHSSLDNKFGAHDQKVQHIEQWVRQCGESRESSEHA
jgi:hypothetical protein